MTIGSGLTNDASASFSRQTLLKRSWLESLQVKALLNSALLQKLQDSQVGETATSIVVAVVGTYVPID